MVNSKEWGWLGWVLAKSARREGARRIVLNFNENSIWGQRYLARKLSMPGQWTWIWPLIVRINLPKQCFLQISARDLLIIIDHLVYCPVLDIYGMSLSISPAQSWWLMSRDLSGGRDDSWKGWAVVNCRFRLSLSAWNYFSLYLWRSILGEVFKFNNVKAFRWTIFSVHIFVHMNGKISPEFFCCSLLTLQIQVPPFMQSSLYVHTRIMGPTHVLKCSPGIFWPGCFYLSWQYSC